MIGFDLKRVAEYIHKATTEELLDRVTVYRDGMEPAALDLMEGELDRRGVTREQIAEFGTVRWATAIRTADARVVRCDFCDRPAVIRAWSWYRLFGRVPIYPAQFTCCAEHGTRTLWGK